MPQIFGDQFRLRIGNHRQTIVRMIKRVTRDRERRFEAGGGFQPVGHIPAMLQTPAFQQKRQQDKQPTRPCNGREELIARGVVEPLCELPEPANCLRRSFGF